MPTLWSATPASHDIAGLRRARTVSGLAAFEALARGAAELAQLIESLEEDAHRLEARARRAGQMQAGSAAELAGQRTAQEAESLRTQAEGLRDALASLRRDLDDVAHADFPAAQREALLEQLTRDEAAAEAVYDQVQGHARQASPVATPAAVASLRKQGTAALAGNVDANEGANAAASASRSRHEVHVQGLLDSPAHDEAAANADRAVPEALQDGLRMFAGDVRKLVYAERRPRAFGEGEAQTDSRVAALQGRWALWSERTRAPTLMDPNEMTQWVMRQAYVDNSEDMRTYAYKLHFQTELKSRLRDELQRAREHRSDCGPASDTESKALTKPYAKKRIRRDPLVAPDGIHSVRAVESAGEIVDADALNDYIRDLETALSTTSDDMQVAQLELQGMSQRQQQVMNALSNLSKSLHETSMAILRKIGN